MPIRPFPAVALVALLLPAFAHAEPAESLLVQPAFAQPSAPSSDENLVVPCGVFDELANPTFASNLAFWTTTPEAAWSSEDAGGTGGSGSARIAVSTTTSAAISQCVPVVGGELYELAVDVLLDPQGNAEGQAGILARWHADEDCTEALPGLPTGTAATFADAWKTLTLTATSPAAANSARVELRATKTGGSSGSTFTAYLDNAFFAFLGSPGCGDPVCSFHGPSSSDALHVLRAAVGSVSCLDCYCDVNGAGGVTSTDALLVLKVAVGLAVDLDCPACG